MSVFNATYGGTIGISRGGVGVAHVSGGLVDNKTSLRSVMKARTMPRLALPS